MKGSWQSYQNQLFYANLGGGTFLLDPSYMDLPAEVFARQAGPLQRALSEMRLLEGGAIANPDEGRMVGHYWLRAPERAPSSELRGEIERTLQRIQAFCADVHGGREVSSGGAGPFRNVLVVGIGGSALGPQMVAAALGGPGDRMRPFFIDNTDPDGIARTLGQVAATTAGLAETLVVVISKSGGTKETRNGQLAVRAAYGAAGLDFAGHAVAITGEGSELHKTAQRERWRAIFPMWDWVGGRTSELSAVGLLPAALQGIDIVALLRGARDMDELTRVEDPAKNPAALLSLCWLRAVELGRRDMVILPYKDRLELFSRYLQQLVMESLGKERDRQGRVVHEGLSVFGNKGSTDQHAYVQQLRDGVNNFFATFIEVLRDHSPATGPAGPELFVEPAVTSGDYLLGFLLGTRQALHDGGRLSVTLTVEEVSPYTVGALIALYERAVGLYAAVVDINAYHQPGVEAGKKAAAQVLEVQHKVLAALGQSHEPRTAAALAAACGAEEQTLTVWKILEHLAANGRVRRAPAEAAGPMERRYHI